jgi:hypothetical protein
MEQIKVPLRKSGNSKCFNIPSKTAKKLEIGKKYEISIKELS